MSSCFWASSAILSAPVNYSTMYVLGYPLLRYFPLHLAKIFFLQGKHLINMATVAEINFQPGTFLVSVHGLGDVLRWAVVSEN